MDQHSLIPDANFVAFLGVPVRDDGSVLPLDTGTRCPYCCHWSHPLTMPKRITAHGVALTYVEWLVYAWHIQHHQRGVPLA